MNRIPNDEDIVMSELASAGDAIHKAKTTGVPVHDVDGAWNAIVCAARGAYLTGQSLTQAAAEEAVNLGVQLTDGQLWTATQEAQIDR